MRRDVPLKFGRAKFGDISEVENLDVFIKTHGLVENHSNISHARVDISIQEAYAGSHLSRAL